MPYITDRRRVAYDQILRALQMLPINESDRAGELNYLITKILLLMYPPNARYREHNEAMGVLSCCAREYYRRRIVPYENEKIKENGDVF